jgi:hypothetical protein
MEHAKSKKGDMVKKLDQAFIPSVRSSAPFWRRPFDLSPLSAVRPGEMSVSKASKVAEMPKEEQVEAMGARL